MSAGGLAGSQRAVLACLADVLIAQGRGMPAASAVGVPGELIDRCLEVAPVLGAPLGALLDEPAADAPEEFVRQLAARRPDDFAVLSTAVVGAYYLSGEVRDLIGYPGQQPSPLSVAGEPDYLDMLERVYERHPGYREAP
ncbi:MAG: hypothetical protein OXH28_14040 [bacterium]|nr:hypothetical protein [bacterium]MXV89960.1 hypothetical protein [Acidimicrobiia bacterium]MYC45522.1 hypothetical protein [Acidimicrobiia bacterium]MYI19610.1 hypothetical protein [Acidimicrobiia bacterium]